MYINYVRSFDKNGERISFPLAESDYVMQYWVDDSEIKKLADEMSLSYQLDFEKCYQTLVKLITEE